MNIQSALTLRTAAWYGDFPLNLQVPDNWDVNVIWPKTPPPLSRNQIAEALQKPIGQPSILFLCEGKKRPLIIVDDLNRPTPPEQIITLLLGYFEGAGIALKDVTILMATGTHGKPAFDAIKKKVGLKAAESCRLISHDCFRDTVKVGETSYGTPVLVNRALLESDFVVGIGGIYPNYTAGFGGGTKLALGVLGLQSIFDLHFRHQSAGWGCSGFDTSFRRDLNEIARMIGLQTIISLQINADRRIVRIDCGDPLKYYPEALEFCNQTFGAPSFLDANVVISNTYPNDLSLTFARMKGFVPLTNCGPNASRVAIASCHEGMGLHNIFPFLNKPRFYEERYFVRLLKAHGISGLSKRAIKYACNEIPHGSKTSSKKEKTIHKHPKLLFRPGEHCMKLPDKIPGIVQSSNWSDVIKTIHKEQSKNNRLKVVVYPCAFLQFINNK